MNQQDEQTFPTYAQWLASHSDATIAALLHRLVNAGSADLIDNLTGTLPEHTRHILRKQPESSAALLHLSAMELAVLHAASEIDAAHHPATEDDIVETLGELFDIAGTTPDHRPTRADVTAAIASLTRWGLIFGPAISLDGSPSDPSSAAHSSPLSAAPISPAAHSTSLAHPIGEFKVPPQLPQLFQPTTAQLWRLVDATACPIPTAEIPSAVADLPPRQRRLLTTLLTAGGVGHSASLNPDANPDAPLPTMVRHGILDQLDDHTARLSGRIQQHLRGTLITPPGGTYTPSPAISSAQTTTTAPSAQATQSATDTGTATAIQLVQELADSVRDLAAQPLSPLTSGGLGIRELTKVARRRSLDPATVEDQLTWLVHANLAALGAIEPTERSGLRSDVWSATTLARDFVTASPARAWALLLLGWSSSTYAPWFLDDTLRAFDPELFVGRAGQLRGILPALCATDNPPSGSPEVTPLPERARDALWRRSPGLTWSISQVAWAQVWDEAARVGLVAAPTRRASSRGADVPMVPTRAATALADTLDRVRAGDCPDPVADLAERLESVLPAPVDTLIIQADHTIMAPGLLSADDAAMLARIADQESAGMASVWRVSKESLLRALGGGASADEILEFLQSKAMGGASGVPQSLSYLIADAQRALAEGAATPTRQAFDGDGLDDMAAVLVEAPRRAWQGPDAESLAELDRTIDAAVEAFRRSVADIQDGLGGAGGPGGAGGAGSPQVVTDLRGMMSALKNAYASGTIVELAYADRQGEPVHDRVSVVMMSPSVIAVVSEISGESFTLQPHRLTSVANA